MSKSPNHDSINDEDSRSKFPGKEINKVVNLNTSSNKDKNVSPNNHAHHNNRTNYIVTNPHQLDQAEHSHTHAQFPLYLYEQESKAASHKLQQFVQNNKQYKHKLSQLENKNIFFEGQLNPIYSQNQTLKQHLTQYRRIISSSTDMLRNLLPQPSSPDKRLQLQLANLEGVSVLIRQDWLHMEATLSQYSLQLQYRDSKIQQLEQLHNKTLDKHRQHIQSMQKQHGQRVGQLTQKLSESQNALKQKIRQTKEQIQEMQRIQKKQLEQEQRAKKKKDQKIAQQAQEIKNLNTVIGRLRQEISQNLVAFEQSKKLIVDNYMALMAQKENQLRQQYEYILKIRQEQYLNSTKQLNAHIEGLNGKITSKQEQILQLYQNVDKYISEKDQLNKLYEVSQLQVKNCKEQIHKYLRQIQQKTNSLNTYTQELTQCRAKLAVTQSKLSDVHVLYGNIRKQLEDSKTSYMGMIEGRQKQLQRIQQIKDRLERQSSRNSQRITELLNNIQQMNEQIYSLKEYKHQNQKLVGNLKQQQRSMQLLQAKLDDAAKQLKYRQEQLESRSKQWEQKCKQHEQEKSSILNKASKKLAKQLQNAKKSYMNQMNKLKQQHDTNMSKMQEQLSLKEKDIQKYIQNIHDQYKAKLSNIEQAVADKLKEMNSLQQTIAKNKELQQLIQQQHKRILLKQQLQTEQLLQIRDIEHRRQLQQVQKRIQQIGQQYNRQLKLKQEQYGEMQKQKEQHYKFLLFEKQAHYKNKLLEKQEENRKQIEMLEENIKILKSSNALVQLENKYNLMIDRLQIEHFKTMELHKSNKDKQIADLKSSYENTLHLKHTQHTNRISSMEQKHEITLRQLQQKYSRQLEQIQGKISANMQHISKLNQQLYSQQQAHSYTKMTRQQKIEYLCKKIEQMHQQFTNKETRIIELEIALEDKEKQLKKIDLLIEEKMRNKREEYEILYNSAKQQFERKMNKNIQQCNQRVKKSQIQRIHYVQNIYKQFQDIKQRHQRQTAILNRRYNQLQQLFEQRPSRQEDLNKIKELSLIRQQMEMEVRESRKKMNSANQIVRYLNLQLQNYKNIYDIFGPESYNYNSTIINTLTNQGESASTNQNTVQDSFNGNMNYLKKASLQANTSNANKKQAVLLQHKREKGTLIQLLKYKNRKYKTQAIQQMQQLGQRQQAQQSQLPGIHGQKFVRQSSLQNIAQFEQKYQDDQQKFEEQEQYATLNDQSQYARNNRHQIRQNRTLKDAIKQYRMRRKTDKSNSVIQKYSERRQKTGQTTNNTDIRNTLSQKKHSVRQNQAEKQVQKIEQFRSNAQNFLSLIKSNKPPSEVRKNNHVYGKLSLKRRKNSKMQRNPHNNPHGTNNSNNMSIDQHVNTFININGNVVTNRQDTHINMNTAMNRTKQKQRKYQIKDKIIIVQD